VYILRNDGGLGDDTTHAPTRGKSGIWSSPPYLRFYNLDRFDFNKSTLTDRLRSMVHNLAIAVTLSWKSTRPITTVRLVGHTNSTGEEIDDRELRRRQQEVLGRRGTV
jgi:hypothetical protein